MQPTLTRLTEANRLALSADAVWLPPALPTDQALQTQSQPQGEA
ncbi:MAG: hypothetical protein ACKVQR_04575 [Aquabacterium sp.]